MRDEPLEFIEQGGREEVARQVLAFRAYVDTLDGQGLKRLIIAMANHINPFRLGLFVGQDRGMDG